jgi:hypothetical protein
LQNATDQPFAYIFNSQKANSTDIKKQFQRLFADPTQSKILFGINGSFFTRYRFSLDGTDVAVDESNITQFTNSINENHPIFNFIQTF